MDGDNNIITVSFISNVSVGNGGGLKNYGSGNNYAGSIFIDNNPDNVYP